MIFDQLMLAALSALQKLGLSAASHPQVPRPLQKLKRENTY